MAQSLHTAVVWAKSDLHSIMQIRPRAEITELGLYSIVFEIFQKMAKTLKVRKYSRPAVRVFY